MNSVLGRSDLKVVGKNCIVEVKQAYKHIEPHQAKCDDSATNIKYLMLFAEYFLF
jgi:hypothetical protein